jgi:hypothetical protein
VVVFGPIAGGHEAGKHGGAAGGAGWGGDEGVGELDAVRREFFEVGRGDGFVAVEAGVIL